MLTYSLSGPEKESPSEAIAAALAEATSDYGDDAEKIHIHVMQLVEVNGKWHAVLSIALEPALEEEEEGPEEKEEPKKEMKEPDIAHLFAGNENDSYQQEMASPLHEIALHEAPVHVYIPSSQEPGHLYQPHLYKEHPEYYFHFLDHGSLWEATKRLYPDIDLYEVAHALQEIAQLVQPEQAPSPQPKARKKGAAPELTEDA